MASRKIIKKLLQLAGILMLIVIALPVSAYLLLQNDNVQSRVVSELTKVVRDKLGTEFSVGSIDIAFLYRIRLNNVYLEDLNGDTIIFAEGITTGIRYIDPLGKAISIGSISLDEASVNLVTDDEKGLNLKYFIDKLKGDGKKEGGRWTVEFHNLRLEDSRFTLRNTKYEDKEFGINYTDLVAYDINADIRKFKPAKDSLSFFIRSLQLKEQSGLNIEKMTARFSQSSTFLSFRDVNILAGNSAIKGNEVTLRFQSYSSFQSETFRDSVRLKVNLDNSQINLGDLSYFAGTFRGYKQQFTVSGKVNGPLSNIRGKDLTINFGKSSLLKGNLNFEGLPYIRQTFIIADIDEIRTSAGDISTLEFVSKQGINMPEQLVKLGNIQYTGNFTGFINDFVAYGEFRTDLGKVKTDLLFRPDTSNQLSFEGRMTADNFNLGALADASDKIGNISLSATIDGARVEGKTINASLDGVIHQFDLMQYRYTNISLSGDLENKTFNGSVAVHDPNIDLEFLGEVDFSDSIPRFDFTANVTNANPYELNISRKDPDFMVSFYVIAKAYGNSINTMNGEIKLLNSLFVKRDKQLQIYDLNLESQSHDGNTLLTLRSDFMDAELSGNFELTAAGETYRRFLYTYLPSLLDPGVFEPRPVESTIHFTSAVKNIRPLLDFFAPNFNIAEESTLALDYEPSDGQFRIYLGTASLKAGALLLKNLNLNAFTTNGLLQIEAGSEQFTIGNQLSLENFTSIANASSDTAGINIRWNNWQDLQYKGAISALARISRKEIYANPHVEIDIRPSSFVTGDTVWHIQPGNVIIDSTSIEFMNIALNHGNEYFRIEGKLSENISDELSVAFNRFNLANLNTVSGSKGYSFGGVLNGNAKLSGVYSNPLFTSTLKVDSLIINNEMLGNTEINSSWNDSRKSISLEAFALRDNLRTINIKGEYVPAGEGKLDFDLELEKLRLNVLNPYVTVIFEDLRGIASGKVSLKGSLKKPLVNGELDLQKTTFTVGYLKSRYSFSHDIQIENNNIYFDDIRIFDSKGNSAWLNGAIRSRYMKDFVLDLNIRADNFMALNTTMSDNDQFYGTAFATGTVRIQGPPKNLYMDINASTNPNTSIKIPLSNSGELNEYPFISVRDVYGDDEDEDDDNNYQADLSGIQIRCRLTVTPDADVQIIIDPQLGEIIKGRGAGNLDIRINSSGDFVMTGDYIIEEGDYLFTLQKLINKRLTIEPGGSIRWDGDPLDATVDIVATYRVRSSLNDLLGYDDEQNMIVDDRVILSGKLMSPDIKYDIYLPDADETTRLKVAGAMTTTEEKSRQFISLLINQKFSLSQERGGSVNSTASYTGAAGANFSEMLSNQLSNWLSQIVNDLDVDVNYRSNRQMNSEEVQVALSYQLFNNKLTINGSVDMATNAARDASDEIVGEFDIDYKLTDNGKVRLKTFNHANNELLYEDNSTYTQGIGITYKEEFNTFGELMRRLFGKKEEKPEIKKDDTETGDENHTDPPVVNNYR